jgi:Gpi18-like mannosyltransferase
MVFSAVVMALFGIGALFLWKCLWPDAKPATLAWMGLALAVVFLIRLSRFEAMSHDYEVFLAPWVEHFRRNGGFLALRNYPGDYNVPYLYLLAFFSYLPVSDLFLIKLASTVFDLTMSFGLVWAVTGVRNLGEQARGLLFLLPLSLPTVLLNSADWGQCDSMYAAFAVLSLGALIHNRSRLAVIMAAMAFAVKLQAVFFLPLGLICLLTGRIRWRNLFWFPAAYLITIFPAMLFGRPFLSMLMIYFNQTQSHSRVRLQLNAPSLFALLPNTIPIGAGRFWGIVIAGVFVLALTAFLWVQRRSLDGARLYAAAAAFCLFVPFLLPGMHDRYFFLADVLTAGLVFAVFDSRAAGCRPCIAILAPVFTQLGSYTAYRAYLRRTWLFGGVGWLPWTFRYSMAPGAVFMLLGGVCVLWVLLSPHKQSPQQGRKHPPDG